MPVGMALRKYHCAKCGTQLKTEKIHRIVTRSDKDYYRYHKIGTFPLHDYDVYSHRFQCPGCKARISYDAQAVIRRIQKKLGSYVLSSPEIKQHYKQCKSGHDKGVLLRDILIPAVLMFLTFALFYLFGTNRTARELIFVLALFGIFTTMFAVGAIRSFKGNYRSKFRYTYSHEKQTQLERLHAFSSHNRSFVSTSNKCYCFYCQSCMAPDEIIDYADNEQTAVCPKCNTDAIIPDSIDEVVDENIISQMHAYWF